MKFKLIWKYIYIVAAIGTDINQASLYLNKGDLVAIPTETVYGLAANAFNPNAIAAVFEAKNRPTFDPLIVHTHELAKVYEFTKSIHPKLLKLAEAFWPGPLTLLLPKKDNISDLVTSGLDRVGVRIPNHPLTLSLLKQLEFPLAAPSANPFGYISPTTAIHVNNQLGTKIPFILDGGSCQIGLESTIVGEENGQIIIYRLGGLSIEFIKTIVGEVTIQINQSSNPKTPGQLKSHYAPKKPIFIGDINELQKQYNLKKVGLLIFGNLILKHQNALIKNLSPSANYQEAATNLFSFLRDLDESEIDLIICHLLPEENLGIAINDRLLRASS